MLKTTCDFEDNDKFINEFIYILIYYEEMILFCEETPSVKLALVDDEVKRPISISKVWCMIEIRQNLYSHKNWKWILKGLQLV